MRKAILAFSVFFSLCFLVNSQIDESDSIKTRFEIQVPFSFNIPSGELSERFGVHSELGANFNIDLGKLHIVNSFSYIFGRSVKDSLLFSAIADDDNLLISSDNVYGDIRTYQRGFNFFSGLSYSIWKNDYLDLRIQVQAGYLNYKTRIEVIDNNIPQLDSDYKRGYDDMMHGLAFREFIGIYYTGDRSLANFYIGFHYTHSNTESVRNYSYRYFSEYNLSSKDRYAGIQAGWIIKIGDRTTNRYYY